jgi:hypothetical protein
MTFPYKESILTFYYHIQSVPCRSQIQLCEVQQLLADRVSSLSLSIANDGTILVRKAQRRTFRRDP